MRRKHLSIFVISLLLAPSFACLLARPARAANSNLGWDFEDHTYNHAHLTQLSNSQIVSQLEQSSAAFQAHGLPIPEHLAYPFGEFDQRVIDVVSQYRLSGRTAGSGFINFPESYPVADWYRMSAVNFCTDYSMDHMKGWVDKAIAEKGLLHMFTHQVVENPPRYSCSPEMLAQILDYLAAKRDTGLLSVMTIKQAYDSFDGTKAIVVFSFDDGFGSVYTTAWPMFKARGMAGTAYISPSTQDHSSPGMLTWAQVLEMAYPEDPPNKPVNPSPPSGATGISTSVTLSVHVADPDGDAMNVSFYQPAVPAPAPINFTIIALPDTQYYSQNYPWIFDNQTQWVVDNVESMNIVFVSQQGDMVNDRNSLSQWNNANHSLSMLDRHVPWGVLPGLSDGSNVDLTNYNSYFGYDRFNGENWYGGGYQNTNTNSFQLFSVSQDQYLIFHFQYYPSDDVLAWANTTINNYPERRVIVVTHYYLNFDGNRTSEGESIWQKFVKPHADQIFLVLCAGIHAEARRTDVVGGHTVYQLLANYQYGPNGGDGWLRTLTFYPAEDKIQVGTYSPYRRMYSTDQDSEFTLDYDMTYSPPTPKLIGTAENIPSGGVASVLWSGLNHSTFYQWYAVATDPHGLSRQSDIWNFTTAPETYTLTVASSPTEGGSVTLNNTGPYYYDDKVLLTAVSNSGWSFSSWSGDLSGSINPSVVTMTSNKSVTAIFAPNEYTLIVAVSPIGSGSVNLNNTGPYHFGDRVQLTAVPATGWAFSAWSGDLAGSVNPAVITIDGNKSVTSDFVLSEYSLTVTVHPSEAGSVILNNTGPYHYGDWVRLTAVVNSGWLFSHWSGDASGTTSQLDIFIDGDESVTANFALVEYTLTVSVVGQGSTNATGTHTFTKFTNVTVLAIPDSGWMLDHWTLNGTLYAASSLFTVNMTANYDLTAVFTPIQYSLVVSVVGFGVTNSTGTFTFDAFSNVAVLATADSGYYLDHWLLNGSNVGSVNPYMVNMTANYELTAVFLRIRYSLTVSVVGHGVTNVTGTQVYDEFTNVSVWAVPDSGSFFDRWLLNGSGVGSLNPYTLNMTGNFELTAVFLAYQRTLTVSVVGNGATNATGTFSYDMFSNVSVFATPDWGYRLDYWLLNGSLAGSVSPYTLNMTSNFELTAVFAPIEYSLFVGVVGNGVTNVTGVQTYLAFTDVPVLATADSAYYLVEWLLNGSSVGSANPYVVSMIGNYNLTAVFAPIQYNLTVTVTGQGTTNATGISMYYPLTNVTVLATPGSGYMFDHWILNGSEVGSENPYTLNMTGNFELIAVFVRIQYSLTVSVSGSGSTNAIGTFMYDAFSIVEVLATPDLGYYFNHWMLNGSNVGSMNPYLLNMTGNFELTAVFSRIQYSLTVSVSGQGSTNATGTFMHDAFSNVTVLATPASGWVFDHWILDSTDAGSANPYTVNMTDNFSLTAVFAPIQYSLVISTVGGGFVVLNNTGPLYYGDHVLLTANPDSGWSFDHWEGDLGGSVNPEVLTIAEDMSVTAVFARVQYSLSVKSVKSWYWTDNTTINSVVVADVDGDGFTETVTGGYYYDGARYVAQLCVWNSSTLALESVTAWYWTSNTRITSIAVGDVDADGSVEIVTGGIYDDGARYVAQLVVWDGSTLGLENVRAWYWTADTVIDSVVVGDVDADGSVEIVTGGHHYDGAIDIAQLCVWDGGTLAVENVKVWYWTSNTYIHSVAAGDVDGDGFVEIVTGGSYFDGAFDNAQLVVWDGSTLALENVRTWYWTGDTAIYSVALGDLEGDGSMEIVTGGYYWETDGEHAQLVVWNGSNLTLENVRTWHWGTSTRIDSVVVGDVDADGSVEIVTGGYYGDDVRLNAQLCVWSGSSLALDNVTTWYWIDNTIIYSVAAGDVDNDGSAEIVTGGHYYDARRDVAQLVVWGLT